MWLRGVVVITTAQLCWTKLEFTFCTGSNPARGVWVISNDENLQQWWRLEIRLVAFCRATILPKRFIIVIMNLVVILNETCFMTFDRIMTLRFHSVFTRFHSDFTSDFFVGLFLHKDNKGTTGEGLPIFLTVIQTKFRTPRLWPDFSVHTSVCSHFVVIESNIHGNQD